MNGYALNWRETMQRMLARMEEHDLSPAVIQEARAVLEAENDASATPAAYLWGGCLYRPDEIERGRPGAVELYTGGARPPVAVSPAQ